MEQFDKVILFEICRNLNYKDFINFCKAYKKIYNSIYSLDEIWTILLNKVRIKNVKKFLNLNKSKKETFILINGMINFCRDMKIDKNKCAWSMYESKDLEWWGTNYIPKTIRYMENLEKLVLGEKVFSLPEEIKYVTKMKKIKVSHDRETFFKFDKNVKRFNIPKSIGHLTNLSELRLEYCNIKILPLELFSATSLKVLCLNHSRIKKIPKEIGNLLKLEELDLDMNKIKKIPKEFGKLTNLKKLTLGYNSTEILPKDFWNLINLEIFYFNDNRITEIPEEIGKLTKLKQLTLDGSIINYLPCSLTKLNRLSLLDLDVVDLIRDERNMSILNYLMDNKCEVISHLVRD